MLLFPLQKCKEIMSLFVEEVQVLFEGLGVGGRGGEEGGEQRAGGGQGKGQWKGGGRGGRGGGL